jgi:hypothetical protein
MSYASPNKSFPELLKNLSQTLGQPTGIAVLASIGIHAALGVSLPYLPLSSQPKPKPIRNVQLLELSPKELSQLPAPSPSPLPLPSALNQQLQPLPSLSSPLSGAGSSLPSSSDKSLSLSDLPPISSLPSTGGFSWQIPKRSPNLKLSTRNSPSNDLAKQKPQSKEPLLPGDVFESKGGKSATNPKFQIAKGIDRRIPIFGNADPNFIPPPPPPDTNSSQTPDQVGSLTQPPQVAVNPGATGLVPQNQLSSPPGIPQAVAPGQENLTNNGSDRQKEEVISNLRDWSQRNQVDSRPQTIKISRNLPSKARSSDAPNGGFVLVAVKVDDKGQIIRDSLEVTATSFSNGALDEDAKAAVLAERPFQATGKPQAYYVQVQYKNDSGTPGTIATPPTSAEQPTSTGQQNSSPSSTPVDGKTSTQRQNSLSQPIRIQPLTPAERQNSLSQPTRMQPLTLPEQQNQLEWSTPTQRQIPSLRPTSPGASTPVEGKKPAVQQNFSPSSTPVGGKKPAVQQNFSPSSTPVEGKKPAVQQNFSPSSTPVEGKKPTGQSSAESRSLSEMRNSEKPEKLPEPQSSEKPQRLPEPPNSAKP